VNFPLFVNFLFFPLSSSIFYLLPSLTNLPTTPLTSRHSSPILAEINILNGFFEEYHYIDVTVTQYYRHASA
jgi:hypothetical protein